MNVGEKVRKASMGDVAKAVGVSKTTISRYLHGEFAYMSPETRKRIEEVIKELDYRPNKMAQSLKATVSYMIGVTIADLGNPFSSLLIKGIQEECRERDVQLLVCDSNNRPTLERNNIESLLDAQVDGLIVNTVGDNDDWLVEFHDRKNRKPVVMLDRTVLPVIYDSVATDNDGAVREMMLHLKDEGFSRVVFITKPGEGISTRLSRRAAVEKYSGSLDLDMNIVVYDDDDDLREKIAEIMRSCGQSKVCLFSNNDESMRDVLEAVPFETRRKVGMCSFADRHWAKYSGDGITCLDQNPKLLGRKAARKLFARVYDGVDAECSLEEVPASLNVFASTKGR